MTRKRWSFFVAGLLLVLSLCAAWVQFHWTAPSHENTQPVLPVVDSISRQIAFELSRKPNQGKSLFEINRQQLQLAGEVRERPRGSAKFEPFPLLLTILWARKLWNRFRWRVALGASILTLAIGTYRQAFGTGQFLLVLVAFAVLLRTRPVTKPAKNPNGLSGT
jgi:hypothetical protein